MFVDDYGYHIALMNISAQVQAKASATCGGFDGPLTEEVLDSMWNVGINGVISKHGDIVFLFDTMIYPGDDHITCLVNEQFSDIHSSEDKTFFLDGSEKKFVLRDVINKIKELYPNILGDLCL